jgi:hypothetical protein
MRSASLAAALVVALLSWATASYADWIVERVTQPAKYSTDGQTWTPIANGMVVPEGSTIFTGPRGRALIKRGSDTVIFAPNTVAAIVNDPRSGFRSDIVQKVGGLILEVERRDRPHTRVRTPFLAAVVKGTTFEVQVGRQSALVSVTSGVVEVTDLRRGERVDVQARQSVIVSMALPEPLRVQGRGHKAPVQRVPPAEPEITPFGAEREGASGLGGRSGARADIAEPEAARGSEAAGGGDADRSGGVADVGSRGNDRAGGARDAVGPPERVPGSRASGRFDSPQAGGNAAARGEARRDGLERGRHRAEDAGSTVGGAGAGRAAASREVPQAGGSGSGRGAENRGPDAAGRGNSGSRATPGGDNRADQGNQGQNAGERAGGQGHGGAERPDTPGRGNSGSQPSPSSETWAEQGDRDRGGNASNRSGQEGTDGGEGGTAGSADQDGLGGGGGAGSTASDPDGGETDGGGGSDAASNDRGGSAGDQRGNSGNVGPGRQEQGHPNQDGHLGSAGGRQR